MKKLLWTKLHPLIVECCTGLFEAYGVAMEYVGEVQRALVDEEGIAAFIGFTGEQMRGTLVISAPFKLLAQVHPINPSGPKVREEDQRDWTGELANQLLGRLKIRLGAYGITFALSTPTTLVGRNLRGVAAQDGARFILFRSEDCSLYVQFDAQTRPDFDLLETPIYETAPVQEGDMMLF
jgi:CheY-specific phosphatase CheX